MIQKPAITSLASANGPSVTTRLPPDTRMRVPLELGWSPSAPSSTPALAMSALNFLMGMTISGLGTAHFSRACTGAGSNIMNRIVVSPFGPGVAELRIPDNFDRVDPGSTDASNEGLRNRQVGIILERILSRAREP